MTAWQAVDGGGGVYTFTIESGRYAVATVCAQTAGAVVRTQRLLTSDTTELAIQCPWHARTGSFTGSISGLETGDTVFIQLGTALASATFGSPTYSAMVLGGGADLMAARMDSNADLQRMIIERGFPVQDGGSINFDLGAGGFAPVINQIEITGALEGEEPYLTPAFYTARGAVAFLGELDAPDWAGVPAAQLEANDVHVLDLEIGSRAENTYRQVFAFMSEAADVSLAFPPPGDDPTVTVADTSPYVRLRYEPARASGHQLSELRFGQTDGPESQWRDFASSGWLDAGYPIETPDLSDLDGWNPDWALQPGATVNLRALSYAGDSSVARLVDGLALVDAPPGYWGAQVTGLDGLAFTRTWWQSEILP